MLLALMLTAAAPGQALSCGGARPVAGDMEAARRIADATIRSRPALRRVTDAAAARRPYRLVVEVDRDDPGQWSAFQMPQPSAARAQLGGGGLEFRIDRCPGAISRMHYSR